jgi:hypothetical protein
MEVFLLVASLPLLLIAGKICFALLFLTVKLFKPVALILFGIFIGVNFSPADDIVSTSSAFSNNTRSQSTQSQSFFTPETVSKIQDVTSEFATTVAEFLENV